MTPPTRNDTGFHPAPGYMLVEIFMPDKVDSIVLPNKVKDDRRPDLEHVYVLEHNNTEGARLAPGTRVLVSGGGLVNLVPGRKLSILKEDELLGVFDA